MVQIPLGQVFVMGDARDDSYDSRHYGLVREELLRGKLLYFWWSAEPGRIGQPVE